MLGDAIRRHAAALDAQAGAPRYGIVESYNPNDYTATVRLQPDDILTGWLPIRTATGGNGWGIVCGLVPGQQVTLEPHDNDPGNYVITGFVFSLQGDPPHAPPAVPSGEIWIVHETGSFVKLLTDGTIASKGTWNHDGDINATGEVTRGSGTSDSVTLGKHTHNQPPDSGGNTQQPTDAPTAGT